MKRLTKKNHKMSVEAYACACGSPDNCIYGCMSGTPMLQDAAQGMLQAMAYAKN